MTVRWLTAFLDTPAESAAASEEFWAAVTASPPSARRGPDAECATLLPANGDAYLRVQVLGSGPARVHLDVHVDDVVAEAARARTLGTAEVADGDGYVVLRSPGGFIFCLVPHEAERARPTPVGDAGERSLVDQLCLNIPAARFPAEAGFWSALTGWDRRSGALPEFEYLQRPPQMPIRLLLQRLGDEAPRPTRAHLDLACENVPIEARRHVELGATVVGERDLWTVMRDPAGRLYCLTGRDPGPGRCRSTHGSSVKPITRKSWSSPKTEATPRSVATAEPTASA